MRAAPPQRAAALLQEAEDGDYAAWHAVSGKVWRVFEEAQFPWQRPLIYHLQGVGPVAKFKVDWAPQQEQADAGAWPYEYQGFHGTKVECLRGILAERRHRAGYSGAIFCVAQENPGQDDLTEMLVKAFRSTQGEHGIALQLFYKGRQHRALKRGGTKAEREATEAGYATSHEHGKSGKRWTFPERHVAVRALWLNLAVWKGLHVGTRVQGAQSAFA
jgi:hypothetical protein